MKLVLVNWLDAAGGNRDGWRPLVAMTGMSSHACVSVGFLLHQDDDRIVVVPHVSGEQGDGEIVIPRSWLDRVVVELAPRVEASTVEASDG